jgi:hypothetical protein
VNTVIKKTKMNHNPFRDSNNHLTTRDVSLITNCSVCARACVSVCVYVYVRARVGVCARACACACARACVCVLVLVRVFVRVC